MIKWTKEKCLEIALKYKTRSDFKKFDKLAYDAAVKRKWLNDICTYMIYKTKPSGYYTKDKCKEISSKINSISDFQKNEKVAYNKCLKNNWINEMCSHMIYNHKPNNYWTKDKCHQIALQYNSRNEFRKNNASVYRTSLSKKWLNDICSHMKSLNEHWNYDKCKKEALKYLTRSDFQKNSKGAYRYASQNKILNDICSHMLKIGNREKRCVYVFEFDDNFAYIGLTYNLFKRELEHNNKGPVYRHIKNTNSNYKLIQLTEYIDKTDAQRKEENIIKEYEINCWNLLNTNKDSTLGGSIIYWTYERCKLEALKYKHRDQLRKNKPGCYNSARQHGWLDDICSHMIFNTPKRYWKDAEIKFLKDNYCKGIKYCAKYLNKSYYSIKSMKQKIQYK